MMKKIFLLVVILSCSCHNFLMAGNGKPDTVTAGIYITSIHDIDFRQKEYTVTFWLWLIYKNKAFDFYNNLEVPQAKTVNKSFVTLDSSDTSRLYMLMKLQCVMKDSWKIGNFPFDHQQLRLSIENSQFDAHDFVFVPDTAGKHFDPRFTLAGWNIDSCLISTGTKAYETGFGDESLPKPHTEYSAFKVKMIIERDAFGLFWKLFLGMYIAFLIAYACFFIHPDSIESRFGLSVGSLFAVIGNKYIVDAALPESGSFTLVDSLHGNTLFFILGIISCTIYSLKLVKDDQVKKAKRFDRKMALLMMIAYLILNSWLIIKAYLN